MEKELLQKIVEMPKIELHVHVEGATKAEVFYSLAQQNNVKLSVNNLEEWKQFFKFKNFAHFIDVYIKAVSVLKKPEDYAFLIENFYKYQAEQNIIYTEAFLSASFMVQEFPQEEMLNAVAAGIKNGYEKYGVKINFIPDIARNIPDSKNAVLDFVIEGKKRGLFIGLGLGGMENGYPPELFKAVYAKAKQNGLRLVAHAGEAAGADSIWGAVNELKAERIGHGIRCLEDVSLTKYLSENKIPVEVSPTSNYCLGIVKNNEKHPIRQMLNAGIFCTLNSDDPAMFSTNLNNEYRLLAEQGFTYDELIQLNTNAIEASFLSEKEKSYYRNMLYLQKLL